MLTSGSAGGSEVSSLPVRFAFNALLLSLFCSHAVAQSQASAQAILRHFYQAADGRAWQRYEECASRGSATVAGKTGSLDYIEDLRSGADVSHVQITALGVKQADGDGATQSWHQDANRDIQLSNRDSSDNIDDRYLTSRAYWRPDFGGAAITVLPPQSEGSATWDRLHFQVPGGSGFTLWINRQTGLLDRVEGKTTKELSDYRPVNGVMLPFEEKRPFGSGMLSVVYTQRTLRQQLDSAAFAIPFRDDYQMPRSGEVSVPAEGGLIFQTMIDGKGPYKTVFDTGAVNIMSAKLARELGLKLDAQGLEIGTSSPASAQVHRTHVHALQIGNLLVRDQSFYVIDLPDEDDAPSLLVGYELLRRFAVRVDFEQQRLTFYDGPRFHYSGSGTAVGVRFEGDGNALLVRASIGEASGWFELDSGNEFGTMVHTGFTVTNNLVKVLGAHFLAYNGRGLAGPSPQAYLSRVNSMRIGEVPVPSFVGRFSTDPSDKNNLAGLIGQDILSHFTEVFDCMRGQVYFEATKESAQPEVFNRAGLVFDTGDHGLQVMTVLPDSPGAQAGVENGDVIIAIDGKTPEDDINQPAFLQPPGTQIQLTVQHGTKTRAVTMTLRDVL
jgi:gag-polyprotein putative aspartyl protease/PDZ domain